MHTSIHTGKTIPIRIPRWRSLFRSPVQKPTRVGPPEQPTSPAKASRANIAVPPFRMVTEALLNVPGQRIPTDNPHSPHPSRLKTGFGLKEMHR